MAAQFGLTDIIKTNWNLDLEFYVKANPTFLTEIMLHKMPSRCQSNNVSYDFAAL